VAAARADFQRVVDLRPTQKSAPRELEALTVLQVGGGPRPAGGGRCPAATCRLPHAPPRQHNPGPGGRDPSCVTRACCRHAGSPGCLGPGAGLQRRGCLAACSAAGDRHRARLRGRPAGGGAPGHAAGKLRTGEHAWVPAWAMANAMPAAAMAGLPGACQRPAGRGQWSRAQSRVAFAQRPANQAAQPVPARPCAACRWCPPPASC
jgi:hypothetical protein